MAAAIPEDRRTALAGTIPPAERGGLLDAEAGARLANELVETARRVGLVAAADLRYPAKVLTRLDERLPKMPTAGRLDDLEDFFANAAPVRSLVSFAASSQFAKALEA